MIKDIQIIKDKDGISVKIYRQGKIMGNHFSIFRTTNGYKCREFNMDELIDKKILSNIKKTNFHSIDTAFNRIVTLLPKKNQETLRRKYDIIKKST